jgi:hypothetical protein
MLLASHAKWRVIGNVRQTPLRVIILIQIGYSRPQRFRAGMGYV